MKATKIFMMAALALMTAACSNDDNDFAQQPTNGEITITATLDSNDGATTRALVPDGDNINSTWATTDEFAILFNDGTSNVKRTATVSSINGSNVTITFTIPESLANNTACTIVYPASAANAANTGADVAAALAAQDGTIDNCPEVRVGTATIDKSTHSLSSVTKLAAQNAIFKFTVKNSDGSATIDVKPLTITIGSQDYVITPASATSELFVALPPIASQAVTFTATGSDSKTYTASKASVSFDAGKYYQSNIKMTEVPTATPLDNSTKAWTDGNAFTVPAGGLTYSDAITVSGNVTLTLTAGETLTLNKGISLASGATLTIDGTGSMVVNGSDNSTASTVAGSTGTLVLTSGTLTAKGGNGQSLTINWSMDDWDNNTGASGGVAINGNVTVSGGTVTATGGNGGNLNTSAIDGGTNKNHGGNGGAAISGSVTVNGGTWTATDGSNGTYTGASGDHSCSAGAGGAAVAGTVTDNR